MTRKEAKAILENDIVGGHVEGNARFMDAFWMAVDALSQEPCDDAISRDELLKAIDTWDKFGYTETGCFVREPKGDYVPYIHYDDVIKCIKGMPSVTQKSGKWIALENRFELGDRVKCSECGQVFVVGDDVSRNYCPNCGAKMVEPQESEEDACKDCYYNDGEVHAECVICDRAESEDKTDAT